MACMEGNKDASPSESSAVIFLKDRSYCSHLIWALGLCGLKEGYVQEFVRGE